MFLFLSKLLPLLIYPLGLTCLLLVLALVWLRRYPRRASVAIATALGLLLVSSNPWVSSLVVKSLEWQTLPTQSLPTADAIVVLGGSIYPATPPRPWVEVSEAGDRVLYGVRLYQAGKAPLIIFSGGRITWNEGGPSEAADMAEIALAMGVPETAILQEGTSLNTYQNAVNVNQILAQRQLKRVLLVTSAIHMPRSLAIFQKQGIEAIPATTDYRVSETTFAEMRDTREGRILALMPDAEHLYFLTRALKEYVGLVIYRLRGWL
jgi:uncharacterized SAM-binding protein YcdF (DUF218 family)